MSLDEAGFIIHAFNEASTGDIFVQKSSACLIDLVKALKNI